MRSVKYAVSLIDRVNDRIGRYASLLILVMLAVMTFEVVSRYAFNRPTDWAQETTQYLYACYSLLAGGYVLFYKRHVSTDILYARFSTRTKAVADLLTSGLFFFYVGALVWFGQQEAFRSLQIGEHSGTVFNPIVYPVRFFIPVGALLLWLQGASKFVHDLAIAFTGKDFQ